MRARPVRVLHVLGGLSRGGAETWAVQLLRDLDRSRLAVDLLVHKRSGCYEEEVRRLGVRVLFCPKGTDPFRYTNSLRQILREAGPYDVVHSHLQLFSGLVVRAAAKEHIAGRIAHSRNSSDGHRWTPLRAVYRATMRLLIEQHATHLFAVSTAAAEGAFGQGCVQAGRCHILSGIDFSEYRTPARRDEVRASLGLAPQARVVGHVGNLRPQKNHAFLLELAKKVCAVDRDAVFVLIGNGELRPALEAAARAAGLDKRCLFLGERRDVRQLLSAMDAFVLPSLYEGLPRALIEAQAAGLPCVASDSISAEAAATPQSVRFVSLAAGLDEWVLALGEALSHGLAEDKGREAIAAFASRGLTIEANARFLSRLYEDIANAAHR